ncbi:MAG: selenide, water dikinase SelD, partial [Spirochaetales bacterium]|nr:selenide, water dikinase SelD [Spirochaetales bacterium]
ACTDITGFGLGGHLYEMASGCKHTFLIHADQIPILDGAIEYASFGLVPGGAWKNQEAYEDVVSLSREITDEMTNIIFDPQTSGGLLIAVPDKFSSEILKKLEETGHRASAIGETTDRAGRIEIIT